MTTAATRIWTFATVILIVVIVALGWFLGVSPKVSEIARAEAEFVTVQAQNELNRIALAQIEDDFARLGEYREELDEIRVEFPELPEYDSVTSKILAELGSAGLVLDTLSISEPAPSIPDVTVNEFGQLPPGTLVSLNITISASGTLLSALDFISAMQASERLTLATNLVHSEGRTPDQSATTVTFTLFMITGEPAEGALPTSGAPAGETPAPEEASQ